MFYNLWCFPAYGRKNDTALKDWEAGKDFQDAHTGQYFSKRDIDYLFKDGVLAVKLMQSDITLWMRQI